jgi:hypothetical protein
MLDADAIGSAFVKIGVEDKAYTKGLGTARKGLAAFS